MEFQKISQWLYGKEMNETEELRRWNDPDKEKLFEGYRDLKGTLDKSNNLLGQVLEILTALNTGDKYFEINVLGISIKISLKDKIKLPE